MRLTLNSVFTNWKEEGIFKYLDNLNVPWKGVVDYKLLDLDFHSENGQKIISTTVYNSITTNTGLTPQERQNLANLCFLKYNHKWEGWWNSLELETTFKPLANTDWKETITTETSRDVEGQNRLGARSQTYIKGSQTDNQTVGEQTTTESERTNTVGAQTNTQEDKVSAFNSSTYQPDKSTTDNTGARTDTIGGGSVNNSSRSDSQTEGERTDTNNQAAATDETHSSEYAKTTVTTEKVGNIGVTTSGRLLDDYRTAVDFEFFEKVYTDLCNTLVIDIFETCFDDLEDYVIKQDYVLPTATVNRLGGIKVGRNLSVEADGTLNAQAEAGDVQSVNGKTGVVVLTNEDVNAPSLEAFNNLAASKQDKIVTEGFENGTFYGIWNGVANFREVFQVPAYDGTNGQVLTKVDGVRYEWKDSAGGGYSGVAFFTTDHKGQYGYKVKYNTNVAIPFERAVESLSYNNDFCEVVELTKVTEPYSGQKSYALKILKDGLYNFAANGYLSNRVSDYCYTSFRLLNNDETLSGIDLSTKCMDYDGTLDLSNSVNVYLKANELVIFRYFSGSQNDNRYFTSLQLSVAKLS